MGCGELSIDSDDLEVCFVKCGISEICGLDQCSEVLMVSLPDNYISQMKNFGALTNLITLNLSNN